MGDCLVKRQSPSLATCLLTIINAHRLWRVVFALPNREYDFNSSTIVLKRTFGTAFFVR